jgi:hypothetical protein
VIKLGDLDMRQQGAGMRRWWFVAAMMMVAGQAWAGEDKKDDRLDVLAKAPAPYIGCVVEQLDRLGSMAGRLAGENLVELDRRWTAVVSGTCDGLILNAMPAVRLAYGNEPGPPVAYLIGVTAAARNMMEERINQEYRRSIRSKGQP